MSRAATPSPFIWNAVLVDGHWIHYRVAGPVDAPPMIHQHGFAISGSSLIPTAELLTDSFRVYVPDLPGFGRSPKPAEQLSIEQLATSLGRFMDAVGVERAVLVGNSLGCAIIAELVAHRPEKVSRAVLVGLAGGQHNQPLGRALLQIARDGFFESPGLVRAAAPDYLRFGPLRALTLFRGMIQFPAFERFIALPVPAMVVIGSQDPLRPPWKRIAEVMHEIPRGVTIVLFEGAAHAINFTHPRELAHAIRQYVAGEEIRMEGANLTGVPVLQLKRPV